MTVTTVFSYLPAYTPKGDLNLSLGSTSELLMLLAAMAYSVTFVVFAYDLVRSSQTIRDIEKSLVKEEKRALAAAAAGKGTAGNVTPGSVAVAERDESDTERDTERVRHRNATVDGQLVDDDMDYDEKAPTRRLARVAIALMWLSFAIHAAAVVTRSIAAQRVPWGNMYEFMTTGALVVVAVYLVALMIKDIRFMGVFVSGLVVAMMCSATMAFPTPVQHLQPALQSPWLIIHVSIAVLACALFTLTFAMAVLQLIQSRRQAALLAGREDKLPWLRLVPSAVTLENVAYRINAVAFVAWTLTLILGAVWANEAWGRPWGWDTKEVWTFIIWVVYAGYLHARATRGWTGDRSAWLSIIGYGCIIFNFTVVNTVFAGLHSYAGI